MTSLGEFETLVLMAVMRLGDQAHPLAVRDEIERRTKRRVARGAVYVTLDRLEAKQLLGSRIGEGEGSGRPRRYYRASAKGLRAVRTALEAVRRMRHGLEPLLGES